MAKLSDVKPLPLQTLLKNKRDPGAALAGVAVIIAQDVGTGAKVVVFGRELLEDIARTKVRHAVKVLIVEVNFESDDLERLNTLIDFVKGRLGSSAAG